MEHEQAMMKDIRSLDSDMQTLVYENYNKFISATDTIRKVGTFFLHFCCMSVGTNRLLIHNLGDMCSPENKTNKQTTATN